MSKKISGAEYPLAKIFSSDFEYHIPSYQRPYAWTIDQASELLDDILAFHDTEDDEGYFLGSIVLIKEEDKPYSEVIDGQQRLTTLTMLLACIASMMEDDDQRELKDHIIEPGKKLKGIDPKPRLSLRERDKKFFKKYVQELKLEELGELDTASLDNESQQNIQANCSHFLTSLEKKFGEDLEALADFVTFLLNRCFIVIVSTPSQESAFRVFSVMNSRGLDLQPTDIIKADLIGQLKSEKERQEYNDSWEQLEVDLTRNGFNDLFSYIRMIYAKEKAKRSLLEEFRQQVLPKNSDPKKFIDEVLEPNAEALQAIRNANYVASKNAEDINWYIKWLLRIDNSDWIPPAMLFLKENKDDPDEVEYFFERLERLAAYMHVCRLNVNQRIEIYAHVIREIEKGCGAEEMEWLDLGEVEIEEFCHALDGDVYKLTPRRRNYLILRLDSFISDGAATYDPGILTIEHVLPQTVDEESDWADAWPDKNLRKEWVHRIANLVPLNKKKNSAAQNYNFDKKCKVYFKGKKDISSYALTSQVLSETEWSPTIVEARQEELLEALKEGWDLVE